MIIGILVGPHVLALVTDRCWCSCGFLTAGDLPHRVDGRVEMDFQ